jgi:PhnB protein
MVKLNPYLAFNGSCAEAFKFYETVFGAKPVMAMTYGQSPMAAQTPPEMKDRVMHASITVGDVTLMGSDAPPHMYKPMQGIVVNIGVEDPNEADRVFAELSKGGAVTMPIAETFWAHRFGALTDKFGTPWMVNCLKQM